MNAAARWCLVTGASNGIGLATATALAAEGRAVVMHGRNADKLEKAAAELAIRYPDAELATIVADFSSLDAVRGMAEEILQRFPGLEVLINNAGLLTDHRQLSADGLELTFAVNHLAPYLLTRLLRECLVNNAPARIAFNSSSALGGGHIDFADLQMEAGFNGWQAYSNTKLANMLISNLLARDLAGTGVVCNAFCPGLIDTDLLTNNREFGVAGLQRLRTRMRPVADGAITPVWLATAPAAATISGAFFLKSHGGGLQPLAIDWDQALARQLERISAELAGLDAL